MSEKILDELCLFALDTKSKDLPHNIKNIIKLSIADWISVLIAGNNEPVSKIIKNLIKQENGNAESTVIGLEKRFQAIHPSSQGFRESRIHIYGS